MLLHMAEFDREKDLIRERIGTLEEGESVVEYLDRIGFLSDAVVAAHTIYVDADDIATLKRHGVGVGHNPKANSRAASGMSPAWEMFHADVDIGLGTDGPMSSNQMDVMNVMSYAAAIARLAGVFVPMSAIALAGGPMNVTPCCSHSAANAVFSARKPQPGCSALQSVCFAACTTRRMSR